MWVKLGNEHLNLDHVLRVRFNKGWKNGQEEIVAEVESLIRGEIQVFARYRGREAAILQAAVQMQAAAIEPPPDHDEPSRVSDGVDLVAAAAPSQSSTNTIHDM